jgi:hypothetical protein
MQSEDERTRTILWHRYGVNAVFSPVFMEIKNRLKSLLRPNYRYVDGMNYEELQDYVNQFSKT